MNTDKLIRYRVVLSNTGENICGGYRKDRTITPMPDDEELKMVNFYTGQRMGYEKKSHTQDGKDKICHDRIREPEENDVSN